MRTLVLSALMLATIAAAELNVAGEWQLTWGATGNMNTVRLTLEQRDAALTGRLYSDAETFAPMTGRITGQAITFTIPREQAGTSFVPTFTGSTDGTTMKGAVGMGPIKNFGTFTAIRK